MVFLWCFYGFYCRGKTFLKESFSPCTPFQRTELRGFIKCKINSRPCHPERSVAKSNCEAAPSKARWDLGRNTLKFHYRSRFAPSLGSGSTAKISHREIFSAQDDIRYVNIAGRGELCSPAGAPRRSPTGLCKHCALFRRDPAFRRFFAVSS